LDDVVLKNGGAAEDAEDADGENRDGDGSGNGETGAEADVDRDGAEDDSEERAKKKGADAEFRWVLIGRYKRLKSGGLKFCHGYASMRA
jgi:hypothetical protein